MFAGFLLFFQVRDDGFQVVVKFLGVLVSHFANFFNDWVVLHLALNSLRGHVCGHFHLPVTQAGVIDGFFQAFGSFVGDPVRAALATDEGRDIPYDNHTEAKVNGKGGCALHFRPATNWAIILFIHGFLRVR